MLQFLSAHQFAGPLDKKAEHFERLRLKMYAHGLKDSNLEPASSK
jgi:hypothetical protein